MFFLTWKSITRWSLVTFLCAGALGVSVGCRPTLVPTKASVSVWAVPRPIEILRGLMTGFHPKQVEDLLCKRWVLGSCRRLQRLYPSSTRTNVRVYLYEDTQGPYPCHHRFFFGLWGLERLVTSCEVRTEGQAQARIRRYLRWLGDASPREDASEVYVWDAAKHGGLKHRVHRKGSVILAQHEDLRMRWLGYLPRFEPRKKLVPTKQWTLWQEVPPKLQREVLRNLARVLYLWHTRVKDEHILFRLKGTGWSEKPLPVCVEKETPASAWQGEPWKTIGFVPDIPISLRYRFRWKVDPKEQNTRVFFQRSRTPFSIEAEGCGYRFLLEGERSDGGFENLLDFILKRIRVFRL